MKILILNPPSFMASYTNRDLMGGLGVNNVANWEDGFLRQFVAKMKAGAIRIPVLSLVYSASILAKDHDVQVIDAANEGIEVPEVITRATKFSPDWIISATSISTVKHELRLLKKIKENTGATVAVIGDATSHCGDGELIENKIDFVILGDEPELAVQQLSVQRNLSGVVGVSRVENGKVYKSNAPASIQDLDSLPHPRWDLFPFHSYRYFPMLRHVPFASALGSRGCPYGCIYCPYTANQGLKYRYRTPKDIFEELSTNYHRYGIRSVQFRDPTFTLRKERIHELCDLIIESQMDLELGCETRIDCLDEKLIDKMALAGFRGVNIGIESTDPNVIRNAKRGWISPELILKNVTHLRRNKMRVAGFFVLGLPGENPDTIQATLDFSNRLPLSYAEFKIATPFPGTPLLEMAIQNKWIQQVDIESYSSYTATMQIHPELTKELLEKLLSSAYRRFYLNPRRVFHEVFSEKFILHMFGLMRNALSRNVDRKTLLPEPILINNPIDTKEAA